MATMHDIPALPLFEEAKSVRELLLDALGTDNLCDEATNYLYREHVTQTIQYSVRES